MKCSNLPEIKFQGLNNCKSDNFRDSNFVNIDFTQNWVAVKFFYFQTCLKGVRVYLHNFRHFNVDVEHFSYSEFSWNHFWLTTFLSFLIFFVALNFDFWKICAILQGWNLPNSKFIARKIIKIWFHEKSERLKKIHFLYYVEWVYFTIFKKTSTWIWRSLLMVFISWFVLPKIHFLFGGGSKTFFFLKTFNKLSKRLPAVSKDHLFRKVGTGVENHKTYVLGTTYLYILQSV